MEPLEDRIDLALKYQKHLSASLPFGADPLAFKSLASKSPYAALCYREAQFYRAEEFARTACSLFEKRDAVAAVSAVRSFTESVAAIWYLYGITKAQVEQGVEPDKYHKKIVRLLVGHRSQPDFPDAVNVLNFIDAVEKRIPGFRHSYDRMSEFAHPNWSGALGMYGRRDPESLITYFERQTERIEDALEVAVNNFIGSCELLLHCYNEIAELLEKDLVLVENLPSASR